MRIRRPDTARGPENFPIRATRYPSARANQPPRKRFDDIGTQTIQARRAQPRDQNASFVPLIPKGLLVILGVPFIRVVRGVRVSA